MNRETTENGIWKELVIIEELRLMKLEALIIKATRITGEDRNDALAPIAEWIRDARQASTNARALEIESARKRYKPKTTIPDEFGADYGDDTTFGSGFGDEENPFGDDASMSAFDAGMEIPLDGIDTLDFSDIEKEMADPDSEYKPELDWTSAAFNPIAYALHLHSQGIKLEAECLPEDVEKQVRDKQEYLGLIHKSKNKSKRSIGKLLSLSK